jgi:hypothetical protein
MARRANLAVDNRTVAGGMGRRHMGGHEQSQTDQQFLQWTSPRAGASRLFFEPFNSRASRGMAR